MRVSLRWLRQHLNFKIEPDALVDCLMRIGMEVEETFDLGMKSGLLVVGHLQSVEKHPKADKLTVCQVDTGGERPLTIVCGATNHRAGDKVPVALPGLTLPSGLTLRRTEIRGVASEGMLCSPTEIAWSQDDSGILILPPEFKTGEPFDFLAEVSITSNRPDCMSIFGLARDIAAAHRKKIYLHAPRVQEQLEHIEQLLHVSVKERQLCTRYCARLIRNVKVGPSPLWMVRALESAGLRSINNVVDVTNFVLLELGHPLHAFDAEMIADRQITVRCAQPGEEMKTLDDTKVSLHPDDLLICDSRRPIALAGIMGGANSEVTETTNVVALESAHFDPTCIRRAASRHGFSTDSSQRFERGADRDMVPVALNRATQLIRELAGGEVAKGVIDVQPTITETKTPVQLRLARVRRLLGAEIAQTEIADILVHLGCEIVRAEREQFFVNPPSYRVDLGREADLIEEIARLHGYDKIPRSLPAVVGQPRRGPANALAVERLREAFVAEGLHEAVNFGFVSSDTLRKAGLLPTPPVSVRNPLNRDYDTLRPSVLVSLLANAAHNLRHGARDIRLFEIGNAFAADGAGAVRESLEAAVVLTGSLGGSWDRPAHPIDFYTAKGLAERALTTVGITQWQIAPLTDPRYHPKRAATLMQGSAELVRFGELHPGLLESLDIEDVRVCAVEMAVAPLSERARARRRFMEIPRFPRVERDIALVADEAVPAGDLQATIEKAGGELFERARLFDLYRGENLPAGKRSLAFALTFGAADRTLRDDEVQTAIEAILHAVAEAHGATLRS